MAAVCIYIKEELAIEDQTTDVVFYLAAAGMVALFYGDSQGRRTGGR
jgi:hypothetical protein